MYSKACSAQWLHIYVAKLKVVAQFSQVNDLKTHLSAFETRVENLKRDLKYLSRGLQPFAVSGFRLKTRQHKIRKKMEMAVAIVIC